MKQGGGSKDPAAGPPAARGEGLGGLAGVNSDRSVGLYIHVPWCRSICTYCDFDRQAHSFRLIPTYVAALAADARRQPAVSVHSIFFGGGTPSLLSPAQIRTVLDACRAHFRLDASAEITVEANPGDLDAARVAAYLEAGVNRLSLGIQSFDDPLLRLLGRRHTAREAEQAFRQARAGGATNVSLDLMYGLPGQSAAHWRTTLERALRLEPDHLSAYLLTIDERVPLGRQVGRGQLELPPDDELAEMYAAAQMLLPAAGLEQYEISNWAKPGRASRHNLTYWRDEPYLALGSGAAGCYGGRRYKHTPNPARYIAAVEAGRVDLIEDETTDPATAAQDHLALRLRLREGLDLERFRQRFGFPLLPALGPAAADLLAAGLLEQRDGRLSIAPRHLLVSNEIILRLHDALAGRAAPAVGFRLDAS